MADFCSCGAQLPADARFCHRCGKPLFADPPPEPDDISEFQRPPGIEHSADDLRAMAAASAAATPSTPAAIGFHNANAVRAGFITAIILWMIMTIPIGGWAEIVVKGFVLLGGGFLAVLFYSRGTGQVLSALAGARLGWVTGVLFYVIWIIYTTVKVVIEQSRGSLSESLLKQLHESKAPAESIRQMTDIMQSPGSYSTLILLSLAMVFVAFTLPLIVSGAVAAKALERE